ncbi:hypothetical protein [Chryseobacterium indologenes]|uniref:hypothetical protein n=1 Tax=Chryseobacterium indologenes TaxID=253 RepID=UPI00103BADF3|nr:hypothetical protein [Chryseobacterium indologenes]
MEETQKTFLSRLGDNRTVKHLRLHLDKHRLTYLKTIGSLIVILAGFVPFTDNIWSWIDPAFNTMLDGRGVKLRSDVWIESLYVTIILCSVGRFMRAYHICYFLPIYASLYSLAMYELMRYGFELDPDWWHRMGFLIMLLPVFYVGYKLYDYVGDQILKDDIQWRSIDRIAKQNDKTYGEN